MNVIVYTAISNGYDNLSPVPSAWRDDAQFVAFVDRPQSNAGWAVRPLPLTDSDPCRNAKSPKILSHFYLPEADYTIWVDGSIYIKSQTSIMDLVQLWLKEHDIAVFPHRCRDCIYKEAEACITSGKDDPAIIRRQIERYQAAGYPRQNKLAECCVLIRRHSQATREFNQQWYNEIKAYSRRDQLSFDFVAYKLGLRYNRLPGLISNNSHFTRLKHLI